MSTMQEKTCAERVEGALASRLEDLRALWGAHWDEVSGRSGTDEVEGLGSIYEYGLCFDYVDPGTFGDQQPYGFWRYQISCGGPSGEFRLWGGGRIEFRYHDWFDGAGVDLLGDDLRLLKEIFDWLLECQEDRHGF